MHAAKKAAAKKAASTKTSAEQTGGKKPGLYANIQAKHERIAHGSGEHMRKAGAAGAPSSDAFARSSKTATKKKAKKAPANRPAPRKSRPTEV